MGDGCNHDDGDEGDNDDDDDEEDDGGDGLLSFFSIPNDCFIVLVYMHYHCFEYLFMHQIFSSGTGFFFRLFVCLFEEVTRGFTVLLVPYCLVQGVVFFCSCSA